jgi:Flp pilus assembly protein TadG
MLLLALSIIFIGGCAALAVDYSLLVNDKNHWQRAVDAAALAGAQELKKTGDDTTDTAKARSIAIKVAHENDVTVTSDKVTFLDDNTKVRVESANTRSLYFARLIGIATGTVDAFAIAGVAKSTTAPAPPPIVPIGITTTTVTPNTQPVINPLPVLLNLPRVASDPYMRNDFLVFDLRPQSAKSPSQMQQQLINGYDNVHIGDSQTSLNASDDTVRKNFEPALADRFQRAAQSPWNDTWTCSLFGSTGSRYDEILAGKSPFNNPRVVRFVVNPEAPANGGTTNHLIVAFQPVYLEAWTGDKLVVRFLPDNFDKNGSGAILTTRKVSLLQ